MDELDLGLDLPEPPPATEREGVSWTKYRPKNPVHCDACLMRIHQAWPDSPGAPNFATYRRREAMGDGYVDSYWCSIHADPKRVKDSQKT